MPLFHFSSMPLSRHIAAAVAIFTPFRYAIFFIFQRRAIFAAFASAAFATPIAARLVFEFHADATFLRDLHISPFLRR
jgi:hypothetical protein